MTLPALNEVLVRLGGKKPSNKNSFQALSAVPHHSGQEVIVGLYFLSNIVI